MIKKISLGIILNILFINLSFAKDISISENLNLEFTCELEKKIVKNSEYNYKTFLADDLNFKNLNFLPYLVKACQTDLLSANHFLAASS